MKTWARLRRSGGFKYSAQNEAGMLQRRDDALSVPTIDTGSRLLPALRIPLVVFLSSIAI
jgi:hypothetical protein